MRKKFFTILTIIIYLAFSTQLPAENDSIFEGKKLLPIEKSKAPWRALSVGLGTNMIFWSINRYVTNERFARVNLNTMKKNLKTLPKWDSDKYFTNMFGHPYQGSHYFNAARANGYSFYESIPFTLGGSLIWEYLLENEPPSHNDIWSTSIGGASIGEITFRLSDLIFDNRAKGSERFRRELLGGIIAPMYSLNRLLTGRSRSNNLHKGNMLPTSQIEGNFSVGIRHLSHSKTEKKSGISTKLWLQYGDLLDDIITKPYDWFQLNLQLDYIYNHILITQMNVVGALRTWDLSSGKNWEIIGGLFHPYSYYRSKRPAKSIDESKPFYISEAAAIGSGLIFKKSNPIFELRGQFFTNIILLGASVSDYSRIKNRDYNYGSGFSLKAFSEIIMMKKLKFRLSYENYNIYTKSKYNGRTDFENLNRQEILYLNYKGENSKANLQLIDATIEYNIFKNFDLSLKRQQYIRYTKYQNHPDINYKAWDDYLQLKIRF